jgi:hypothetical protein
MDCRITSCAHLREVNITGQYSKHCRILHGHNSHSQYWVVPSSVCAHVCTNRIYAALPPDMPISISFSLSHTSPVLHPAPASGPPPQTLKSQGYHPFRPFCQFIFSQRLSLVIPPLWLYLWALCHSRSARVAFVDLKTCSHHFFALLFRSPEPQTENP